MTEQIAISELQEKEILLQVKDLQKTYNEGKENEVEVLTGLNFSIPQGQMTAIMGPSGCGKTTLLNLIGGLDKTSGGIVRISKAEIQSMSDSELTKFRRDTVGYIFQLFNLFNDQSALQNVALPLLLQGIPTDLAFLEATLMLQEVGLGDRLHDLPSRLSGGEQQKVAISRSLITKPRLILADEPTGDLDMATSDDIMALFRRMQEENEGMSIVIVTHSERIAGACDRIIRIDDGKIASDEFVGGMQS